MKKIILALLAITTISLAHALEEYSIFPEGQRKRPVLMVVEKLSVGQEGLILITEALNGRGSSYQQGSILQEYRVVRLRSPQRYYVNSNKYKVVEVDARNKVPGLTPARINETIEFNTYYGGGWEQGSFKFGRQNIIYVISR